MTLGRHGLMSVRIPDIEWDTGQDTRWGNLIAPVRERVQERLEGLAKEASL
jgi:hypothetical protein